MPLACSAGPGQGDDDADGPGDGDGGISLGDGDGDGDGGINIEEQPPTEGCGDGFLDPDEACDDGNLESEDGCGGNCRYVEQGWVCPTAGQPCRQFAKCGDGVFVFPEQCDDANLESGDGCSATCKVEIGSKCEGSPSVCTPTTCGDSMREGAETCDDGNSLPFDGCSGTCQGEPICSGDGCTSGCGDGLVIGSEECDDGNNIPDDGCSAECLVEDGYECEQAGCDRATERLHAHPSDHLSRLQPRPQRFPSPVPDGGHLRRSGPRNRPGHPRRAGQTCLRVAAVQRLRRIGQFLR